MRRLALRMSLVVLTAAWVGGCGTLRAVSDYDEVIDKGITDFSEQLVAHTLNMAELGGRPEGSYAANLKVYNALEARLDTLIARARNGADGQGCKLQADAYARIKSMLRDQVPALLQAAPEATPASANECSTRLLVLVKAQLGDIRTIHRDLDTCGSPAVSCLRPATARSALDIALQSANAVAVVEAAKKPR